MVSLLLTTARSKMGTAGSTAGAENGAAARLQTRMLGYVTAGPRCGQHAQLNARDRMLQQHELP
jgi:hypothetical protein